VVRQAGHEVQIVDLTFHRGARLGHAETELRSFDPQVVCLSVLDDLARGICRAAKALRPAPTILFGGSFATMFPEEVLAVPEVDAVCVWDGEEAICDFLARLGGGPVLDPIPGFWIKKDGVPCAGEARRPADLTRVPLPDWSLWDVPKYLERCPNLRGAMSISASRGCPYACAFCARHALRHFNPGPRYLLRPPAQVVEEISELHRAYGAQGLRYIIFLDHIFGAQPKWLREFTDLYRESGLANVLRWGCQARVEHMTDAWVDGVKSGGCRLVEFGVETVDDGRRERLLNKPIARAAFANAAARLRRAGLAFNAYLMVGVPGNTRREIEESVRYVESLGARVVFISRFVPLRGTRLGDACREAGSVDAREGKEERVRPDAMSELALTTLLWRYRLRRLGRLSTVGVKEQGPRFLLQLAREAISVMGPSGIGPSHPLALVSTLDRVVNQGVFAGRG
jgi:anaerobic magnesium-protoporphyrin IX monomethyl ester cyclase